MATRARSPKVAKNPIVSPVAGNASTSAAPVAANVSRKSAPFASTAADVREQLHLPRRRALRRQARAGRGRQDADRRRGRDHGREAAQAPAAHGGQGLPQAGGGEAGRG